MFKYLVSAAAAVLMLAACSQIGPPAPSLDVDLASRLGEDRVGSFEEEITVGTTEEVDLRHPSSEGECVDFSDEGLDVTVDSARINYNVEVAYDGPELSGRLQARLYAASASDDLWREQNRLGSPVTVNLARESTRLAGAVVLNDEQLRAVNERYVCWGVEVTGRDVSAASSGTATFDYTVEQLRLTVGVGAASQSAVTARD